MIGVCGYSDTRQAVDGYHILGGSRLWEGFDAYKSGTVHRWANSLDSDRWWSTFDAAVDRYGLPERVWWQIGAHAVDVELLPLERDVDTVLARLRHRFTGLVDASAPSPYDPPNPYIAVAECAAQVARLVASGEVAAGPVMPVLTTSLLKVDGVHANFAGIKVLGRPLLDWYGAAG